MASGTRGQSPDRAAVSILLLSRQRVPAIQTDPRSIRHALRPIGEQEDCRGIEHEATSVVFRPYLKAADKPCVAISRPTARARHNDQVSRAGILESQLGVQRAELDRLLVGQGPVKADCTY